MNNPVIEQINNWMSVYASLACIAFVIIYTTITPWWKTPTGRLIMMLVGGLAGLAVLTLVFATYRNYDLVRVIRSVLVFIVGTALIFHSVALIRVQTNARREHRNKHRKD